MSGDVAFALPGPTGLCDGERLLLAGLRAWISCRRERQPPDPMVRRAIACVASEQTGALFSALMETIEGVALRPFVTHCGACPGYGADEQRLVLACGLSPIDPEIAARLLTPLVADPAVVVCFARALNAALRADGLALPVRLYDDAGSRTLH